MTRHLRLSAASALLVLASASTLLAQAAGVPIEPKRLNNSSPELLEKLGVLRAGGKLMSMDAVQAALAKPTPGPVDLPAVAERPLRPSEVAARARQSALRIGWYHLCTRCDKWHVNVAGGYVLSADGVGATCHHVVVPNRSTMREAYLFAMDGNGAVHPIKAILAADAQMDVAIFRMEGGGFTPLAINDQTSPGDAAFVLSDPNGVAGYFSAGIINRFYWEGGRTDGDPATLDGARALRMDVSTDWAPGSSGSAVLDECGNVVGHVSKISALMAPPSPAPGAGRPATRPGADRAQSTHVVLHEASPIRGVRLLIDAMNDGAATPAGPK